MGNSIIASAGMGVDSTAAIIRLVTDPSSRDFDLSDLTVIIAAVGNEYEDTYLNTERVLFPILKAHRIRTVQIARAGLKTTAQKRYVVLDDTASPRTVKRHGPARLSDELAVNGTVAQVSSRRCSVRWKGEPIDAWIAGNVAPGHRHLLGYAANEKRRIDRDRLIDRHGREPYYPLHEWGWKRDTSSRYIYDTTGASYERSACSFCPFQTSRIGRQEWARRWANHPHAAAKALILERTALSMNPRMRMFGATAAWDLAAEHQLTGPLALARRRLAASRWALYEIRRAYTGPGRAMRSVRTLATGSRTGMQTRLARTAGGQVHIDEYGIHRVWLPPSPAPIPSDAISDGRTEHLLTVAPAGVADKQRPQFESTWHQLTEHGSHCDTC